MAAACLCASPAPAQTQATTETPEELGSLSIDQLSNFDISSVSRTSQPLSQAPAAVYVITHDQIMRSGARSIPEILRLAPNLQVARITASSYAISARGFNGTAADKLLVLIDGRSVYTTFYSGVFWDSQDVPPEDIDRIEVISGPGATMWGANAVNGVINIITRNSAVTQGGLASGGGGNQERRGLAQFGGKVGDRITYRAYFSAMAESSDVTASGADAHDGWGKVQGGFRFDWTPTVGLLTLQGDLYKGSEHQLDMPDLDLYGHNLLGRWTQPVGDSTLQVQAYYDYLQRTVPGEASDFVHTFDLDIQDSLSAGPNQIVWGAGVRSTRDRFPVVPGNPSNPLTQFFDPESRTLVLGDAFGQDAIALSRALKLTLGLKLEDDPYSGLVPLPDVRLSWSLDDANFVWAAVSRAIRAPSRLDEDFFETSGSTVVLHGGDFRSEKLTAYELGYRTEPSPRLSLSVSAYYNVYSDLRSFELTSGALPIVFANEMEGHTYGVEAWGALQVDTWWRLSAGGDWLHKDLRFKPGSSGIGGLEIAGDDPSYQFSLRSAMDLPHGLKLDLDFRDVGALPAPASPSYAELGARLAWPLTDAVELSLTGANLLHAHHLEFGSATSTVQLGAIGVETERSFSIDLWWRF